MLTVTLATGAHYTVTDMPLDGPEDAVAALRLRILGNRPIGMVDDRGRLLRASLNWDHVAMVSRDEGMSHDRAPVEPVTTYRDDPPCGSPHPLNGQGCHRSSRHMGSHAAALPGTSTGLVWWS